MTVCTTQKGITLRVPWKLNFCSHIFSSCWQFLNVLPGYTSAVLFLLPANLNIEEWQTLRRYLLFLQDPCFEAYKNKNVTKFFCFTFGKKPKIIFLPQISKTTPPVKTFQLGRKVTLNLPCVALKIF